MKFEVGRNEFLNALQSVVGVVERRQTMPVLSNFLLDASKEGLMVTGTDLELELVSRAQIKTQTPGKVTVPARKLFDIVRSLPEGATLTLDGGADRVTLKSGKSRFSLSAMKPEEFPALSAASSGRALKLPRKALRELLDRTQFAMAQQDVRYYLNGLLLHVTPKRLRAVATDGHRLALSEISQDSKLKDEVQVIVPRKAVLELLRLLDNSDEVVELRLGEGQIQIDLDSVRMTSKLIDGRFPDYERVIPEDSDRRVTAQRERVRQALARVTPVTNDKFRGVRLQLAENQLRLSAKNQEQDEGEDEIEVSYSGPALEIGFNVNYLIDALSAMQGESFTMDFKGSDSSGLIQEVGGGHSKYVVMPMRI